MAADAHIHASRADLARDRRVVQLLLRTGLVTSTVLFAVGLLMNILSGHHRAVRVAMFHLLSQGTTGERVMAWGVLVLACTPAFRVLSLALLWARERDWRFVGV
ncbi:MAG TPA: DUF1634 domain-containing protein, partial [Acidimicrobiales bacterium]|nr:DUF1634 domain-containing protein [Acidimicrobiales bacterium]